MTASDDFLNKAHSDIELRREAWQQASVQLDRECWIGILQKCSNAIGAWRDCPRRRCRRQLGCIDDSLVCHEIARRKRPSQPLTPEQEVAMKAELKRQLVLAKARSMARGEIDDRPARLTRLAEQKLAALRS
jgi:hypothetical protein